MGIPIIPPGKIPDEDGCPACFGEDLTPDTLWVHVAGIFRGEDWYEELGPPPNGLWMLTHVDKCRWTGGGGGWTIEFWARRAGVSEIQFWLITPGDAVEGMSEPCESWFNLIGFPSPPRQWRNGVALVTMTSDCPIVSLSALAESVGLEPGANLLCDPFVAPDHQGVIRYARKRDATNVKIKIDCS